MSAGEDVEKGELFCSVGGNADWSSHVKSSIGRPEKIKNGSAFQPTYPTSGNISKGT